MVATPLPMTRQMAGDWLARSVFFQPVTAPPLAATFRQRIVGFGRRASRRSGGRYGTLLDSAVDHLGRDARRDQHGRIFDPCAGPRRSAVGIRQQPERAARTAATVA